MEKLTYKDNGWYDRTGTPIRPELRLVWGDSHMEDGQHVSSDRVSYLAGTLKELADRSAALDPYVHTCIERILLYLLNKRVTVTFGGHFKAGKTTVVNAALGRAILPVSDYPETGAICLLQSGVRDNAEVYNGHGPRHIDCTTLAIQQEIALLSETGERRAQVNQVKRLRITLSNGAIPRYTQWIDSPGMNDTVEMTERAFEAARLADVLVWVLSSKQFLSESEIEFLARYIAERGPAAVVFLLNIFLPQDTTEAWRHFHTQKAPVFLNKLWYHAPELGFTEALPPMVMLLAGRAADAERDGDFGNAETCRFLHSLDAAQHPRVRCTRLHRAAVDLHELAQHIEQRQEQEKANVATERRALEQKRQEIKRKKREFTREVGSAINAFLSDWTARACDCGANLAGTISSASLLRDHTYSQNLTASLRATARDGCLLLLERINNRMRFFGQVLLRSQQKEELCALLSPPEIDVTVPSNPIKSRTIATSTALGVGVSVLPVIGWAVGALGGAVVGFAKALGDAQEKDVEETKENIQSAVEQAVAAVREKRQAVHDFIMCHCTIEDRELLNIQPNETLLREWESLLQSVHHLADQALEFAHGGKQK